MSRNYAQRKRTIRCGVSEKRFTVVRIGGKTADTHAGRSFEAVMRAAQPDRGNTVEVYSVCAADAGAARLFYKDATKQLVRRFKYKGR